MLQFKRFLEFVPPTLTCVILPILPYNWIILIWHDGIPITVNKITFFGNYGKDERNIEKKQKTFATFCLHNFIFTESQNWSSGLSLECLQTLPIYNSILTRKVVMKLYFFLFTFKYQSFSQTLPLITHYVNPFLWSLPEFCLCRRKHCVFLNNISCFSAICSKVLCLTHYGCFMTFYELNRTL